ncbi:cortex morphogenetic protein CmpA [Alkalicoccobacillus porphyridii]|uniref:Cortex morphogenetic protein CmpA n=1 Tax=Alkalicoccobacillus porphyridii TaxID=2597270 RepID=A0A553ZWL9_9BACI|nr:cortex morphogenetic protein CmpA [Alkalicoccobacillus porphyridii]TSB45857.1 cortex morphogenetic protein CmpA [Alkalicoccobacillus porphyridii]
MPTWLKKQLRRAFAEKNKYQLRVLNQCWFYYQKSYPFHRKTK